MKFTFKLLRMPPISAKQIDKKGYKRRDYILCTLIQIYLYIAGHCAVRDENYNIPIHKTTNHTQEFCCDWTSGKAWAVLLEDSWRTACKSLRGITSTTVLSSSKSVGGICSPQVEKLALYNTGGTGFCLNFKDNFIARMVSKKSVFYKKMVIQQNMKKGIEIKLLRTYGTETYTYFRMIMTVQHNVKKNIFVEKNKNKMQLESRR